MREDVNIVVVWSREGKVDVRHDKRLQIFKSCCTMEANISVVDSARNNWLKLQQKRLKLDIRKNFLRIVKYQDRLPRKLV